MTYFTATRRVLPDGVFPTMITPMNEDKSVDWAGVDGKYNQLRLVYVALGVRSQMSALMHVQTGRFLYIYQLTHLYGDS